MFLFRQNPPGQNRSATTIGEAGARVKLYEWDQNVVSGQGILRGPVGGVSARAFADTTRFAQLDARVGWGRNFELFGFRAFHDLQIGMRTHGLFGHQLRIDSTLGLWPLERVLVLFQSSTAVTPLGYNRVRYLSQKAEASAVYWFTPTIGLQLGGRLGLRGVNTSAERGVYSALWYRF